MIVVTGATGTIGRALVPQLLEAGHAVRVFVRNPARVAHLADRLEVAIGDLDDPQALTAGLAGASRLFLLDMTHRHVEHAIAAARATGVRHIVKLSTYEAAFGDTRVIGGWHAGREALLRDSGLAWTFLRPGQFMSNTLMWAGMLAAQGAIFNAAPDGPVAPIDPADVAAVAVCALTQPGHEGQVYPLTGPSVTTPREQVATLARLLGREIRLIEISPDEEHRQLLAHGMPAEVAAGLLDLTLLLRRGEGDYRTNTVKAVTGREPRDFEHWAGRHLKAFAGDEPRFQTTGRTEA